MNREQYTDQVLLLLDCMPALKKQEMFALKGGTAINFFVRNFPRLSVDIDLTYVRLNQKSTTLRHFSITPNTSVASRANPQAISFLVRDF